MSLNMQVYEKRMHVLQERLAQERAALQAKIADLQNSLSRSAYDAVTLRQDLAAAAEEQRTTTQVQ